MEIIKEYIKYILKYAKVMIILIVIFMIALFLACLIPSKYIKENVTKSSETLLNYGERKTIKQGTREESLFYFADAVMLNIAYSVDSLHPYESMLSCKKNYIPGQTIYEHGNEQFDVSASENYKDENGNTYQTKELYGLMHGDNIVDSYEYSRYWHGYLVYLRPLLVFLDFKEITILLKILMGIFSTIFIFLVCKKINILTAIIYAVTLIGLNVFLLTNSITEPITIFITLISGIFILIKNGKFIRPGIVFMVIGSITSFCDFLTTPLLTLGLTLPLYLLLNIKDENRRIIKDFIKICIAWSCGYVITWSMKWIITDITLQKGVISNAITQIFFRLGDINTNNKEILIKEVINSQFSVWGNQSLTIFFIILLAFIIIGIIRKIYLQKVKNIKLEKINIEKAILFLIIALFPILWYGIVKNHSYIHAFFTYRILIITFLNLQIFIAMCMGLLIKSEKSIKEDKK